MTDKKANSIDQALADMLKYQSEQLISWSLARGVLEPVVIALDAKEIPCSYWLNTLHVQTAGDKKRLAEVVRIFRTNGFATTKKPEAKQTEYQAYFGLEGKDLSEMRILLTFTSTVCRRVQVGTETKEVPIFEIQCGDGDEDVDTDTPDAAPASDGTEDDDTPF